MVILGENLRSLSDSESTQMVSNQSSATKPLHAPSRPLAGDPSTIDDPNTKSRQNSLWKAYQKFVFEHHATIDLLDGTLHRLLFWLPHHQNSDHASPWREVLYGLLSVNQLAMYLSQQKKEESSYGFTLATEKEPTIHATSLRIVLHGIHALMPSILELAAIIGVSSPTERTKRQALIRWRLEQIKAVVRIYLMLHYWKQMQQELSMELGKPTSSLIQPGIMLAGGIYQPMVDTMGISACELRAVQRKRNYRGRRRGLRISAAHATELENTRTTSTRLILGEILYILRPLIWAGAETRHAQMFQKPGMQLLSDPLMKSWLVTFAMDVVSLGILSKECRNGNPLSREEWNRRRMNLLLYLLRSPIWTHATCPALERTSAVVQHVPLFGRVFDSYLWDWILYWKHPFVSEEG